MYTLPPLPLPKASATKSSPQDGDILLAEAAVAALGWVTPGEDRAVLPALRSFRKPGARAFLILCTKRGNHFHLYTKKKQHPVRQTNDTLSTN